MASVAEALHGRVHVELKHQLLLLFLASPPARKPKHIHHIFGIIST
jgi:hypothetical protein